EQGAALDVHGAHRVGEDHHRQDEPGGGGADGLLDDAADVEGGAAQVAEHDGGGAPVRDESKGDAADDDDLGRPHQPAGAGGGSPLGRRHGIVPGQGSRSSPVRPRASSGGSVGGGKGRAGRAA